jgi:hypothetical protein
MFLALEGLYDNHSINALPNVFNSLWEYLGGALLRKKI